MKIYFIFFFLFTYLDQLKIFLTNNTIDMKRFSVSSNDVIQEVKLFMFEQQMTLKIKI